MKTISAEDFDKKFDDGEDLDDYVDWSKATRPGWNWCMSMLIFPKRFCGEWMRKRRASARRVNP